jgi:hypothetical protein
MELGCIFLSRTALLASWPHQNVFHIGSLTVTVVPSPNLLSIFDFAAGKSTQRFTIAELDLGVWLSDRLRNGANRSGGKGKTVVVQKRLGACRSGV